MIDLSNLSPRDTLVAVVGPTGVGKTAFALSLAQHLAIEVVSADSRQVYRYMDIGTAKPSPAERAVVRHHMIDVAEPDQSFSVAEYQAGANAAIRDIQSRGILPVLVGGTGLYVRSVTEGLCIPQVGPDPDFRAEMAAAVERLGLAWLEDEVRKVDPATADRERTNPRRLIRALEVFRSTGRPLSALQTTRPPAFSVCIIGLTIQRTKLYELVDRRVDAMIEAGLLQETEGLVGRGYSWDLPALSSLGYRQLGEYLRGECGLDEAIRRIKFATHAFIRHQYAWFRPKDPRIRWLDAGSGFSPLDAL